MKADAKLALYGWMVKVPVEEITGEVNRIKSAVTVTLLELEARLPLPISKPADVKARPV